MMMDTWSRSTLRRPGVAVLLMTTAVLGVYGPGTELGAAEVKLQLPASRLNEVLNFLGEQHDLQFIATDCADPIRPIDLKAASVAELQKPLCEAFGAEAVAMDSVWFVSGQPPQQVPWEEFIRTQFPPDLAAWFSQEAPSMSDLTAQAKAVLTRQLRAFIEQEPVELQEGECALGLLNIERADDTDLLRQFLTRTEIAPLLVSEMTSSATLQANDQLALQGQAMSLYRQVGMSLIQLSVGLLPEGTTDQPQVDRTVRFLWLERYWKPPNLHGSILASAPVTFGSWIGTGEELTVALADQLPAEFSLPPAWQRRPFCLRVQDMPLWMFLQGLSIVTGCWAEPYEDSSVYLLREPETLVERAYASLSVEDRLWALQFLRHGQTLMAEQLWWALTPDQREQLQRGKLVPALSVPEVGRRWLQRLLRFWNLAGWLGQLGRVESLLSWQWDQINGTWVLYPDGLAYAELRTSPSRRTIQRLRWQGEEQTGEEQTKLPLPPRGHVGRGADRQHMPPLLGYGTRTEPARWHRQGGPFDWLEIVPPQEK